MHDAAGAGHWSRGDRRRQQRGQRGQVGKGGQGASQQGGGTPQQQGYAIGPAALFGHLVPGHPGPWPGLV